jgi:drug/metabolite transporter (DMT)-like permease
MKLAQTSPMAANLSCFTAMMMWAIGFPVAEILLQSWSVLSLVTIRQFVAFSMLLAFWLALEGWQKVRMAPWRLGMRVGGIGFGLGATLLLVGQAMSDAVTAAVAAAMMPIAGAFLEVALDSKKLSKKLIIGAGLAILGGLLATGIRLSDGKYGSGALLCLVSVFLWAWGTRSATRDLPNLSPLGQTAVTMLGGFFVMSAICLAAIVFKFDGLEIGSLDNAGITMFLVFSLISLALSQLGWIWGAGGLGIFLASFHMNAVPFYVMVILVVFMGQSWNWMQALGAGLVAIGVITSQWRQQVDITE